jgi:hypothetical protein
MMSRCKAVASLAWEYYREDIVPSPLCDSRSMRGSRSQFGHLSAPLTAVLKPAIHSCARGKQSTQALLSYANAYLVLSSAAMDCTAFVCSTKSLGKAC